MSSTPKMAKKTLGVTTNGAAEARPDEKKARAPKAAGLKAPAAKSVTPKAPAKPRSVAATTATPSSAPSVSKVSETSTANRAKPSNETSLKKKDLIDQVLAKTGAKKKQVKDIVEATLSVLGDALSKGAMLNLPPFGKAKVSRPQVEGTSNAMTVKLRRTSVGGQGGAKSKQVIADAEE